MGSTEAGQNMSDNQRTQGQRMPARARSGLLFASHFFRHPRMLGSIVPSSRFLIRQLLEPVDWSQARVIVEYGPGVGVITSEVLRRMRPDAMLIAIETNPAFVSFLRSSIQDERLHVVEASAEAVDEILRGYGQSNASYVISGIPFKTIPDDLRDTIVRKTHSVLRPDGRFLVYQFSDAVRPYLEKVFRRVSRDFELLNIIPARLFFCAR